MKEADPGASPAPSGTVRPDVFFNTKPSDLDEDRMLLPIDKLIAGILGGIASPGYVCWPCNRTIAAKAGCSMRTVAYALKRLESLGWIRREPCPTTSRGQVIRLLWRRRESQGKGRPPLQSIAGGSATRCRGPVQPVADGIRSKESEPKSEGASATEGEEAPPSEAEMAMWRDWAGRTNHPFVKVAREIVAKFDRK